MQSREYVPRSCIRPRFRSADSTRFVLCAVLLATVLSGTCAKKSAHQLPPLDFSEKKVRHAASSVGAVSCFKNEQYKFIYVHIPKNGGTAMVKHLDVLLCQVLTKNKSCKPPRKRLGGKYMRPTSCKKLDPNYFSFSFSRNPWSRAVSMWSYGLANKQMTSSTEAQEKQTWSTYCTFKDFVERMASKKGMSGCGFHESSHQWPSFVNREGRGILSFVARLERFERDMATVLARIDPTGALLEKHKAMDFKQGNSIEERRKQKRKFDIPKELSAGKDWRDLYDNDLRKKVEEIWATDCKQLGYTFNTPDEL